MKVRGLELDLITVDLDGVKLDRRILVDEARVVVYDIDRGRVRAEVTDRGPYARGRIIDVLICDQQAAQTVLRLDGGT